MRWRDVILTLVTALAWLLLMYWFLWLWGGPEAVAPPESTLPACVTEDSDNCFWDAREQGNGAGLSFVTLNGTTYYEGGER
jgi:hypothetical protein